jgi:DNA-binding CsgD family transcriptional regulator
VPAPNLTLHEQRNWIQAAFGSLVFIVSCLGGALQTHTGINQRGIQILIKIPYLSCTLGHRVRIQCRLPVLQMAFTHLSFLAGLTVWDVADEEVPLLTDDITQIQSAKQVLWIEQGAQAPKGIKAQIDLSITPGQLRLALETVINGGYWGIEPDAKEQLLSERELEIMALLAQGLRDRDIADRLIISESTVKFHMNNVLKKLKAQTRYQALHQAIVNGWIH